MGKANRRVRVAPPLLTGETIARNNLVQALIYKPADADEARLVASNLAQIEDYLTVAGAA